MKTLGFLIGAAITVSLGGCSIMGRNDVTATLRCEEMRFPIYFLEQSDVLTAPAAQAIRVSAQQARGCPVRSVAVTGLDDGQEQTELSRRRASAVAAALAAEGLPAPIVSAKQSLPGEVRLSNSRTATPVREPTEVVISFK